MRGAVVAGGIGAVVDAAVYILFFLLLLLLLLFLLLHNHLSGKSPASL